MTAVDGWQRRHRWAGVPYAVLKKFGNDNANLVVVALAWYGFTAIFPLLLVVVTLFGFIGEQSLGTGLVRTLHEFPVVGSSFILPRLGRALAGLITIGGAFVINALVTGYATGSGVGYAIRIPALAGLLVLNAVLYFASFTVLTAKAIGPRGLLPGAIAGAVAFTALITVGTGLITHQLKNASTTYGAFGSVIGIVAFLLLLAKLTMYAAELNPVLARGLYPRALPLVQEPTDADRLVLADLVYAQQGRKDQIIGVGFGDGAAEAAASDATRKARPAQQPPQ
jgi:uncharacterized BrkB/YihY/UPF0761 family membrane protein